MVPLWSGKQRMFSHSGHSSSSDVSNAPAAIEVSSPTDLQHSSSVVVKLDGELQASDSVPQAVLAMLPSLRPVEISGPTDVHRRSSVIVTETGELRASASVPKEVLALLPAVVGAVDISAPRGVTRRGSVTARDGPAGEFDVSGPLSGQLADVWEMMATIANQDALGPASVARVRDAFCAICSPAPRRTLNAHELLVCMEMLNARRSPAWAAECVVRESLFTRMASMPRLTRASSRKSTPRTIAGLTRLIRQPSNSAVGKEHTSPSDGRFSIEQALPLCTPATFCYSFCTALHL